MNAHPTCERCKGARSTHWSPNPADPTAENIALCGDCAALASELTAPSRPARRSGGVIGVAERRARQAELGRLLGVR
jgi:hypothetical protein